MSEVVLLHNPRCSKSRATLALLEERGVAARVVEYLKDPLGREQLEELASKLGRPPREWVRSKEAAYAEAGLGPDSSDADVIAAMVAHPILMERPVVVVGSRAEIGRPPERVLEIL